MSMEIMYEDDYSLWIKNENCIIQKDKTRNMKGVRDFINGLGPIDKWFWMEWDETRLDGQLYRDLICCMMSCKWCICENHLCLNWIIVK